MERKKKITRFLFVGRLLAMQKAVAASVFSLLLRLEEMQNGNISYETQGKTK